MSLSPECVFNDLADIIVDMDVLYACVENDFIVSSFDSNVCAAEVQCAPTAASPTADPTGSGCIRATITRSFATPMLIGCGCWGRPHSTNER